MLFAFGLFVFVAMANYFLRVTSVFLQLRHTIGFTDVEDNLGARLQNQRGQATKSHQDDSTAERPVLAAERLQTSATRSFSGDFRI